MRRAVSTGYSLGSALCRVRASQATPHRISHTRSRRSTKQTPNRPKALNGRRLPLGRLSHQQSSRIFRLSSRSIPLPLSLHLSLLQSLKHHHQESRSMRVRSKVHQRSSPPGCHRASLRRSQASFNSERVLACSRARISSS